MTMRFMSGSMDSALDAEMGSLGWCIQKRCQLQAFSKLASPKDPSHGVISWCPVLVSSHGVMSWCHLMVSSHGVLSWCPVMVSSHLIVSSHRVIHDSKLLPTMYTCLTSVASYKCCS